jgi:hypothetical protein
MSRDSGNSREMRNRIAQIAARLMAVDGVSDFALAKRKAARQAGAPDTRNLPNNDEVEQALRTYQQLYQADEQPARLNHLRRNAREMMHLLAPFNPFLSGSVLSGSAGKFAAIEIHLFADSVKELEMFLINRKIPYRSRERRVYLGEEARYAPLFLVSTDQADFELTAFDPRDLHRQMRATAEGRPLERVPIDWLDSALVDADNGSGG